MTEHRATFRNDDKGPLFKARFDGECGECLLDIDAGMVVRYVNGEVVHEDCTEAALIQVKDPAKNAPPVCPTCHLAHAGECF